MSDLVDELARAIDSAQAHAEKVEDRLTVMSTADLYAALGQRISSTARENRTIGIDSPIDIDALKRTNAIQELGQRVFRRWSIALHQFVCSEGGEDDDLRQKVFRALTGKDGGSVALIAGILVAAFGASPAIAAIVATLLVRILVNPAADELCKAWANSLKA